jgi:outer membrane protein
MMRNRRKWILALVLFPVLTKAQLPDTAARKRHEFSVKQAVDYARTHNLQVKNALVDVKIQEQVNREVTSRAYPGINANLGTSYNPNVATQVLPNFISPATYQVLIDEGVKDGSGNPIVMPDDFGFIAAQFGTKYSASGGISLSQILFDGQVFVGLQARKTVLDFARKNVEVTEEMIKTNIYKVYYQLVVGKTQLELIDSNISLLQRLSRDTRIIYENGFAEKLDVDKVNVQLVNLQTEKNVVVNTLSNGYYGLKLLMGMPVGDELVLTDTISDAEIKEGVLEASVFSYTDRKEYQQASLGRRLNQYDIRRWQLSQIPTLSLGGSYAKSAQRNSWNFFGKGQWFTISSVNLNMSIPIFNGFYTRSKIQQARLELQKTENQIADLQKTIDTEVETAKNNFRSAVIRVDFQKKNMELAESVYQQTKKKYEVGTGSQTEINSAQTDLKAAQTNYVNALYDAIVAKVDFLKATGKL